MLENKIYLILTAAIHGKPIRYTRAPPITGPRNALMNENIMSYK